MPPNQLTYEEFKAIPKVPMKNLEWMLIDEHMAVNDISVESVNQVKPARCKPKCLTFLIMLVLTFFFVAICLIINAHRASCKTTDDERN